LSVDQAVIPPLYAVVTVMAVGCTLSIHTIYIRCLRLILSVVALT